MSNKVIKVSCIGDLMCGDSFYALGSGCSSNMDKYGYDYVDKSIRQIFNSSDYVLANIECPISDIGRKWYSLRTLHMRGKPKHIDYIKEWGINIANVSNNHILEQGYEAACDTVSNLVKAGIHVIGHGDVPFKTGISCHIDSPNSIAFIGACLKKEKYAFAVDSETIISKVNEIRNQGILTIIASIHWGDEFIDRPNVVQREIGHKLIDNGVKLVIGHHPHVIQGIEEYNNGLIAYSMGNFIFDQFLPDNKWSMVLSIEIANNVITKYDFTPICLDKFHRPYIPKETINKYLQEIVRRNSLLKEPITNSYNHDVKAEMCKFRRYLNITIIKNIFRMNPIYWPQVLFRPIQRRLGIW